MSAPSRQALGTSGSSGAARLRVLLLALLLATAAGLASAPAAPPAAAISNCPNCASLTIDWSGDGSATITDGSFGAIHCVILDGGMVAGSTCEGHYSWAVSESEIEVTITVQPTADSFVCTGACTGIGEPQRVDFQLGNGDAPSYSLLLTRAPRANVTTKPTGDGAGTIVDVDHPSSLTCSYAHGTPSGVCKHEYVWDPSLANVTLHFSIKAKPGSVVCIDAGGGPCNGSSIDLSLTLSDGATATLGYRFEKVAASPAPTPTARPPSPKPSRAPASASSSPQASSASPLVGSPTGSPGTGGVALEASPTAPATSPVAATSSGDDATWLVVLLAVISIVLAILVLVLGLRLRGKPG